MMELVILSLLLAIALILAPILTRRFFLQGSTVYAKAHAVAGGVLALALIFHQPLWVGVWPGFCFFGAMVYLRAEGRRVWTVDGLVGGIPLAFSLIASVWIFAAANDLHLLGYDRAWSLYAALHGSYLGWIWVGCVAVRAREGRQVERASCFLAFVLFLCVAFGIDGVPYIKRVGVIGFALLVPWMIARVAHEARSTNRRTFRLALISMGGITLSMTLAVLNEFLTGFPRMVADLPLMVLLHGVSNALVTVPAFYLAIAQNKKARPARGGTGPG